MSADRPAPPRLTDAELLIEALEEVVRCHREAAKQVCGCDLCAEYGGHLARLQAAAPGAAPTESRPITNAERDEPLSRLPDSLLKSALIQFGETSFALRGAGRCRWRRGVPAPFLEASDAQIAAAERVLAALRAARGDRRMHDAALGDAPTESATSVSWSGNPAIVERDREWIAAIAPESAAVMRRITERLEQMGRAPASAPGGPQETING